MQHRHIELWTPRYGKHALSTQKWQLITAPQPLTWQGGKVPCRGCSSAQHCSPQRSMQASKVHSNNEADLNILKQFQDLDNP